MFPEGTVGTRLDTLARLPLWTAGLDFNHGTGHGVGAYLNVHEGPQGIGFRKKENEAVSKIESAAHGIFFVDVLPTLYVSFHSQFTPLL